MPITGASWLAALFTRIMLRPARAADFAHLRAEPRRLRFRPATRIYRVSHQRRAESISRHRMVSVTTAQPRRREQRAQLRRPNRTRPAPPLDFRHRFTCETHRIPRFKRHDAARPLHDRTRARNADNPTRPSSRARRRSRTSRALDNTRTMRTPIHPNPITLRYPFDGASVTRNPQPARTSRPCLPTQPVTGFRLQILHCHRRSNSNLAA